MTSSPPTAQPDKTRSMSIPIRQQLEDNLTAIETEIRAACERSGRLRSAVTLIGVTKYAELEWVRELAALGVGDLGESRPQQLVRRAQELGRDVRWHMIGHLQRNKVDDLIRVVHVIHSVDSVRLWESVAKAVEKSGRRVRILLEVNVSGEASKDGFDKAELRSVWPRICQCDSVEIAGLMTMAPLSAVAETARPVFRELRELRDELRDAAGRRWPLAELSMGMSGDFAVGIEEGATMVRIGSRLFDGLEPGN